MIRTQVQLTDAQAEALRAQARRERVSVAELVRRAVADAGSPGLAVSQVELKRRALALAGRFASGRSDVSEAHDDHLVEAFRG